LDQPQVDGLAAASAGGTAAGSASQQPDYLRPTSTAAKKAVWVYVGKGKRLEELPDDETW
jgi:hypothetical protein